MRLFRDYMCVLLLSGIIRKSYVQQSHLDNTNFKRIRI